MLDIDSCVAEGLAAGTDAIAVSRVTTERTVKHSLVVDLDDADQCAEFLEAVARVIRARQRITLTIG